MNKISVSLREKYPKRIPIHLHSDCVKLVKKKYLVPKFFTSSMLLAVIRKYNKLNKDEGLYLQYKDQILTSVKTISEYDEYGDNIIHLKVIKESVFGFI